MPCMSNKGADQTGHLPSLICTFVAPCQDSTTALLVKFKCIIFYRTLVKNV